MEYCLHQGTRVTISKSPAKWQKVQARPIVTYHRFPAEIRNQLYKVSIFSNGLKHVEREVKTVSADETALILNAVHSFYIDEVNEAGRSNMFSKDITAVAETADELLSPVTPWILFTYPTAQAVSRFAKVFNPQASACARSIELNIETDIGAMVNESARHAFASWSEISGPHGSLIDIHGTMKIWFQAMNDLPPLKTVRLVFLFIWRDFRSLRGLSKATGLDKRQVMFRSPKNEGYQPLSYGDSFVAQIIAATKNIEVSEQVGISEAKRAELVRYGCAGFTARRRPIEE